MRSKQQSSSIGTDVEDDNDDSGTGASDGSVPLQGTQPANKGDGGNFAKLKRFAKPLTKRADRGGYFLIRRRKMIPVNHILLG
jgi:hypothetical protein